MAAEKPEDRGKPLEDETVSGPEGSPESPPAEPLDFTVGPGEVASEEERAEIN